MATWKPAYLIHGDDHGRIAERRAALRARAEAESGAGGLEVIEGDASTPESVGLALSAMTFAIGRRFVVVDDPLQIGERFFERSVRFSKTELQEIVYQLTEGEVRHRLELALKDGWEVNGEAVRAAVVSQEIIAGARLVTGSHVRIR